LRTYWLAAASFRAQARQEAERQRQGDLSEDDLRQSQSREQTLLQSARDAERAHAQATGRKIDYTASGTPFFLPERRKP